MGVATALPVRCQESNKSKNSPTTLYREGPETQGVKRNDFRPSEYRLYLSRTGVVDFFFNFQSSYLVNRAPLSSSTESDACSRLGRGNFLLGFREVLRHWTPLGGSAKLRRYLDGDGSLTRASQSMFSIRSDFEYTKAP